MMIEENGTRNTRPARFVPLTLILSLALVCCGGAVAAEVYTWTDEDGIVHFSDSPRASGEMETLSVEEIYRPGSAGVYAAPEESAPEAAAADPEAETPPPLSAAEQRREQIARGRADRQESEAQMEQQCALHRQRLEQMEPARRVFYTNEQGEEVRMDDDKRIGLIEESRAFLAANCKG